LRAHRQFSAIAWRKIALLGMNTFTAATSSRHQLSDHSRPALQRPVTEEVIPSSHAISGPPSWAEIEHSESVQAPRESKTEKLHEKNLPRLINRRIGDLRSHPSYVKHQLFVSPDRLAAITRASDVARLFPILVTRTGAVIDGYARLELARRQNRETILCLEYNLSDQEALRWFVQLHSPSKGLNGFCRSLLALDLEPALQEAARGNQQTGGQKKGLSNLTEAQKVDTRSEIAAIADVSTGSLTKVRHVLNSAVPEIHVSARAGELSVHKAWQWSVESRDDQLKKLEEYRSKKGTLWVSRQCIQKHVVRLAPERLFPLSLGNFLKPLTANRLSVLDSIVVSEIDSPGQVAYLTTGAIRLLRTNGGVECETATC
jgi:hypothetical protein